MFALRHLEELPRVDELAIALKSAKPEEPAGSAAAAAEAPAGTEPAPAEATAAST
jgi:hypothetical protein